MNHLWERLPRKDRAALGRICQPRELAPGDVLHPAGGTLRHVDFPVSGYVSLLASVEGTPALEVGLVGREGMVGAQLALGASATAGQALVQGEGMAQRAGAREFRALLAASPALRDCVGRYLQVRLEQLAGIAPCLRFHVIDARLARWLLMSQDRARSPTFLVKQEFLSYMLGVRRAGITQAARSLQAEGLIRYARGHLTVLDRRGLEGRACACYAADGQCYARQLGTLAPGGSPLETPVGNS